jgi:hypothetical protein
MRTIEVENSPSTGPRPDSFNGFVIAVRDELGAAFLKQLSAALKAC